nr:hypothetical protein CFP56_10149 [Quercus suber]
MVAMIRQKTGVSVNHPGYTTFSIIISHAAVKISPTVDFPGRVRIDFGISVSTRCSIAALSSRMFGLAVKHACIRATLERTARQHHARIVYCTCDARTTRHAAHASRMEVLALTRAARNMAMPMAPWRLHEFISPTPSRLRQREWSLVFAIGLTRRAIPIL